MDHRWIPKSLFDSMLNEALEQTYPPISQLITNQSDFKMELFHHLAQKTYHGVSLAEKVPKTNTCSLHAESRPLNGTGLKADLIVCDPFKPFKCQHFNYRVAYIIEIKYKYDKGTLIKEIKRCQKFGEFDHVYFISALQTELDEDEVNGIFDEYKINNATFRQPDRRYLTSQNKINVHGRERTELLNKVFCCIDYSLNLYGNGRQQFNGFFWCNYEHEINKGWTFPCEGDFNCQLYHQLRTSISTNIQINSEVSPKKENKKIDIVVSNYPSYAIPIEVKMNWNQFRSQPNKEDEIKLILKRFKSLNANYCESHPILVVIQGRDACGKKQHRQHVLDELSNSNLKGTVVYYDEGEGMPESRAFDSA